MEHVSVPVLMLAMTACARCGRHGTRYILDGRLCPSCYNRQLEQKKNRDARGRPPKTRLPLSDALEAYVHPVHFSTIEFERIPDVASVREAAYHTARKHGMTEVWVSMTRSPNAESRAARTAGALWLPVLHALQQPMLAR